MMHHDPWLQYKPLLLHVSRWDKLLLQSRLEEVAMWRPPLLRSTVHILRHRVNCGTKGHLEARCLKIRRRSQTSGPRNHPNDQYQPPLPPHQSEAIYIITAHHSKDSLCCQDVSLGRGLKVVLNVVLKVGLKVGSDGGSEGGVRTRQRRGGTLSLVVLDHLTCPSI